MKDKPIIFSSQMVQAIWDGKKTQTRRLVKQKHLGLLLNGEWDTPQKWFEDGYGDFRSLLEFCPYGRVGDVKQIYYEELCSYKSSQAAPVAFAIDGLFIEIMGFRIERVQSISKSDARAEGISLEMAYECNHWAPSYNDPDSGGNPEFIEAFSYLWDSIYAKEGYDWEVNPFCWVIEFKRLEKK